MFERKGYIIGRQFMKFFMPTVLMTMALSLSTVVDGIIVGNILGSDALAAVNLVLPVTLLFNSVYVLIGVGGSTLYSVALGRRDHERARQLFTTSVLALAISSIIIFVAGLLLCRRIAAALTVNAGNLTEMVYQYLRVVMLAVPFLIVVPGLVYFIRSSGQVKTASTVLIVANVVNLCMDVLLIVVAGTGIGGAAFATGVGYFVGILIALRSIRKSEDLKFTRNLKGAPRLLGEMMGTGLASTINTCLNFFRLASINAIVMIYLGSDGVTAFSVCTSCLSIVSMFVGGSAQTMIPLLGTLHGEGDTAGIRFTIRRAIFITGTSTLALLLLFELIPKQITGLFGVTDPVQVSIASEAIRIYAVSLPFMGFLFISMCVYQVVGHKKLSNVVAILEGFLIVVPAAGVLAHIFGAVGIWSAFVVGEVGTIVILCAVVTYIRRKHPECKGIFLLEENEQGNILDVTMIQTIDQAAGLSSSAIQFCRENDVAELTANRVGVALEEMAINTISQKKHEGKESYIDVRLTIDEDTVVISFRDNGEPFNPLLKHEKQDTFDNISVALAISEKIAYDNILGMNCSIVKINRN